MGFICAVRIVLGLFVNEFVSFDELVFSLNGKVNFTIQILGMFIIKLA